MAKKKTECTCREVEQSELSKKMVERRRKFAELLIEGKSFAEAAKMVKMSDSYLSKIRAGLDDDVIAPGPPKKKYTASHIEKVKDNIDRYFDECKPITVMDSEGKPLLFKGLPVYEYQKRPTISGLAMAAGYMSRQAFNDALIRVDDNKNCIRYVVMLTQAKQRVIEAYEQNLHLPGASGSEFALKNIDNWVDKQQVQQDVTATVVNVGEENACRLLSSRIDAVIAASAESEEDEEDDDE